MLPWGPGRRHTGCTLTDAERNALPERHYAYLTLEQGRHLTETGVQYAKLYALYETPGSALAPAENELALFEQQTAPLTAERLLIPFESDREARPAKGSGAVRTSEHRCGSVSRL